MNYHGQWLSEKKSKRCSFHLAKESDRAHKPQRHAVTVRVWVLADLSPDDARGPTNLITVIILGHCKKSSFGDLMTENITITSGQAVGLTGLSMQTIQRYIRRYPMGFSEQARKPKKGRRFNGDDIKKLLLINTMLHSREQKQHIEAALIGEYESPDLSLFEVQNLLRMFQTITFIERNLENFYRVVKMETNNLTRFGSVLHDHTKQIRALKYDVSRLKLRRAVLGEEDFTHPHPYVDKGFQEARNKDVDDWNE